MSTYQLPELPYDYSALEPHISGEIMELHHDKHHAGYVKGANTSLERIAEARDARDFAAIAGLERALAFNLAGHGLHAMFWHNLTPEGENRPGGELAAAIDEQLGGYDNMRAEMTAVAGSVQGSGWAVLSWDGIGARLVIHQLHDHHNNVAITSTPLLVMDVWEHAFYLQYRNVKADYIERLWSLVNWEDVAGRFDAARTGTRAGLHIPAERAP